MIVLDFNKLTLEELKAIYEHVGIPFVIEDGRIAKIVFEEKD